MGMTYAQYYKLIDKKPTKKQLAQKAKAEKLFKKIKLKKEEELNKDRRTQTSINATCPHCKSLNFISPYPYFDIESSGCECCGETKVMYKIECRCRSCERIIYYKEG